MNCKLKKGFFPLIFNPSFFKELQKYRLFSFIQTFDPKNVFFAVFKVFEIKRNKNKAFLFFRFLIKLFQGK
jgi:hypothetical protein